MTSILPNPLEGIVPPDEILPKRLRFDMFKLTKFNEHDNPSLVPLARRIHAKGYREMRFVNDDAITDDGFLAEDIDKAHGENVEYYIIEQPNEDSVKATLRKIHVPERGSLMDLPAFDLARGHLWDEGIDIITEIENPEKQVKEIAALARTPESNPMIIFELLRNSLQDSMGKSEVWFFSIVSTTYKSLVDNFGDQAVRQIGEPIAFDDPRISKEVTLIPALVQVDKFIATLCRSALDETNPRKQARLLRSLMFFTDGLIASEMNVEVQSVRQSVNWLNFQEGA